MATAIDGIPTVSPMTTWRTIPRPRLSRPEELLTVAFGAWLIAGLFVDGWAHNNDKPETFFTPWHLMFYSGFGASAAWICSRVWRHRGIPAGYGLGVVGVALFAAGGVADLIWHSIFGIEVDLEALLSPSHTVLFVGALLFLTSPLRAAWSDPSNGRTATMHGILPALVSTVLATATVAFFFMEFAPFLSNAATAEPYRFVTTVLGREGLGEWMTEELQLEGFASVLITTVILMTPTLLLLRRWLLPFGSLTMLFGTVTALTSAIEGFDMGETAAAGLVAGVAGDLLVRRLRPSPSRPGALRTVAALVPAVLWLAYFGLLAAFYSVGWSVELWAGITGTAALTGVGLTLLVAPPAVPPGVDPDEGEPASALAGRLVGAA